MKKNLLSILLLVAAVALSVVSWLLLPDIVAVQIGAGGQVTNTMPKALAVIIPLGISVAGAVMNLSGKEAKKAYILAVVGIAVMLMSLLFNR